MHLLHSVFEWIELIIDVSAALIMVLAFVVAIFSYFRIFLVYSLLHPLKGWSLR